MPLEWVYDGLHPLMLPSVLDPPEPAKAAPITAATLYATVASRVGLRVRLVRAAVFHHAEAASQRGNHVPPDVAARQMGRTLATAPAPSAWLLEVVERKPGQGGGA